MMIPRSLSDYLERSHARYSVLSHPVAYTAQEEAAAAHVPGNDWAKAVVCFADDQPILAVLPAPYAVDLNRLQRTVGARTIRLAREGEFARMYKDCEPGAIPPLGPLYGQRVFVDKRLADDPEIVFSAGSHHEAVRMPYPEFERVAQPTVAEFALTPSAGTRPRARVFTDPVCGTTVIEQQAAGRSEHNGETYYFCSRGCKMEFDDNPDGYAR